jgi:hypothetical protein
VAPASGQDKNEEVQVLGVSVNPAPRDVGEYGVVVKIVRQPL